MMHWLSSLFTSKPKPRHNGHPEEHCDELCETLRAAQVSTQEAWAAVNESRRTRGEPPLPPLAPSWEELMGVHEPCPR
jgi:hypothetical protein